VRTSDGYRFGLQFKASSDAHRQVGELLENLGNKKSELVVTAVLEYILAHPEVLNKDNPVRVIAAYGYSEETLNAKIEAMVRKFTETKGPELMNDTNSEAQPEESSTEALDTLLSGLDQFQF
jgi:hypothetical protein